MIKYECDICGKTQDNMDAFDMPWIKNETYEIRSGKHNAKMYEYTERKLITKNINICELCQEKIAILLPSLHNIKIIKDISGDVYVRSND